MASSKPIITTLKTFTSQDYAPSEPLRFPLQLNNYKFLKSIIDTRQPYFQISEYLEMTGDSK